MGYQNIYLIGYRACGKTTLAREIACKSDLKFLDTDRMLQKNTGMSIDEMVSTFGWDYFREVEEKTLADTAVMSGLIVATGGGIILREANRKILKNYNMLTIYLRADADLVLSRLEADPNPGQRPALSGSPLALEVMDTLNQRQPLYMECADLVLDASQSIHYLVQRVLDEGRVV